MGATQWRGSVFSQQKEHARRKGTDQVTSNVSPGLTYARKLFAYVVLGLAKQGLQIIPLVTQLYV